MGWWIGASAWESSVNTNNNTSVCNVSLDVGWNTSSSYAADNPGWSITIDGASTSGTCNFNTGRSSSGSSNVGSWSRTITHNSDGSRSCGWSAGYAGSGSGWQSTGGTLTMTTIARASTMSSPSSYTTGVAGTTTISRKSSSFTHTASNNLTNTGMSATSGIATSFTYTPPRSVFADYPNDTVISGKTMTVQTYNGSTAIGSAITQTFSVELDSGVKPTAPVVTATMEDKFRGYALQGVSKLRVQATSSMTDSSAGGAVSSWSVDSGGVGTLSQSGSSLDVGATNAYSTAGSKTISVTATDSRGRTASTTVSNAVSISAYSYPTLSMAYTKTPSSLSILLTGTYTDIDDGENEIEQIQSGTYIKYQLQGEGSTWHYITGYTLTQDNGEFTISAEVSSGITDAIYNIEARVIDTVGITLTGHGYGQSSVVSASTGATPVSFHTGGNGVTVGGVASASGFRVAEGWDAILEDSVNGDIDLRDFPDLVSHARIPIGTIMPFGGSTIPSGWLECNGAAVNRTTYSQLYAVIGETYGSGDGSTTFNLPDLQGRMPQGAGTLGEETYTLGDEVEAGIPNITGTWNNYGEGRSVTSMTQSLSGAVYGVNSTSPGLGTDTITDNDNYQLGIDASRCDDVYGNSTTVQPNTTVVIYIIKATNAPFTEAASATIEQRIAAIETQKVPFSFGKSGTTYGYYKDGESTLTPFKVGLIDTSPGYNSDIEGYVEGYTTRTWSNISVSPGYYIILVTWTYCTSKVCDAGVSYLSLNGTNLTYQFSRQQDNSGDRYSCGCSVIAAAYLESTNTIAINASFTTDINLKVFAIT